MILTSLLAGLRADELRKADGRHIRTTQVGAAVIHVKGEGGKERTVPIEADLLLVLDAYHQAQVQRIGVRPHALVVGRQVIPPGRLSCNSATGGPRV
ncbi:hypothetical protein [Mycobacterium antarcticum]|uniref:hypothetical protein n=1 Tax=Mycolicibacterium sp. TUM20984 TaxID=3023368 RepID=UPI0024E061AC|nr:hypothetical protein [Mycolicibacterium sp. TUM20984]